MSEKVYFERKHSTFRRARSGVVSFQDFQRIPVTVVKDRKILPLPDQVSWWDFQDTSRLQTDKKNKRSTFKLSVLALLRWPKPMQANGPTSEQNSELADVVATFADPGDDDD